MARLSTSSLAALILMATVSTAWGSSYVMMTDGDLASQADLIVRGRLGAPQGAVSGNGRLYTLYNVEPSRLIQGTLPKTSLRLRVPGGRVGQSEFRLHGLPRFASGQEALLFLKRRSDGDFSLVQLMLGAFHIVESGDRRLALRDLSDAQEVKGLGDRSLYRRPRNLVAFMDWLESRARGVDEPVDYFVDPASIPKNDLQLRFTLLKVDSTPARWFNFDFDDPVDWVIHQNGQPGLAPEGDDPAGTQLFQTTLEVWNEDADTDIDYRLTGVTGKTSFNATDPSVIVFDDLFDEMTNYGCAVGGVLALGGPLVSISQTVPHKGRDLFPIVRSEININKGVDCLLSRPQGEKLLQEVYAHELGHTLGLGHSCGDSVSGPCEDPLQNQALMRAQAHLDGRGAALNADDRAGISFLYGGALESPGQRTFYFAQIGDGQFAGIRIRTSLIVHNAGDDADVTIDFFRGQGQPMRLPFDGEPAAESLSFVLHRGETRSIITRGTGPLQVGFARIVAGSSVGATAIFERLDNGVTVTQAGVPATVLRRDFSMVADFRGSRATGFALAYPPPPDGGDENAIVTLRLYDRNFKLQASQVLVLSPGQHLSQFFSEAFSDRDLDQFFGSVTFESTRGVAAVTLMQDDNTQMRPFPLSVPTLSAFPVIEGRADEPLVATQSSVRRLEGSKALVHLRLTSGSAPVLAAIYRAYAGDRPYSRVVREVGSAGGDAVIERPEEGDDWRISVQLISTKGTLGPEIFLTRSPSRNR